MIYLLIALAFVSGFMLVFGVNMLLVDIANQRREYLYEQQLEAGQSLQQERARRDMERQGIDAARANRQGRHQPPQTPLQRLQRTIDQAGLQLRAVDLLGFSLVVGPVPAAASYFLLQSWLVAVCVAFAGGAVPLLVVSIIRNRRLEKLLSQLPDAFDLMSRVLKAGQTMSHALQAVADEFSDPIASEFGYCYAQQNLGLTPEAALHDLARRTGLLDIRIFVVAVSVQRETGGNLSSLLAQLATVIRERYRIRGQIRSLTAEGKLQANILIALPFIVLAALLVTSRDYIIVLFQYPSLLVGMVVADVLGYVWMRRIINFDF